MQTICRGCKKVLVDESGKKLAHANWSVCMKRQASTRQAVFMWCDECCKKQGWNDYKTEFRDDDPKAIPTMVNRVVADAEFASALMAEGKAREYLEKAQEFAIKALALLKE